MVHPFWLSGFLRALVMVVICGTLKILLGLLLLSASLAG